jgi:hypothetical protein
MGKFSTSTINQLTNATLNAMEIPFPPFPEQSRIVAYLDEQCAAIDSVIEKLMREIELVDEYKMSIIFEAVTGKIDLRNAEIPDFAYLKGHTFSQLMDAERRATAYALAKAGRCSYTVYLPCVCEYTVGQLLTYFMYQTVFAGAMLNIDPYNQPGVETGKRAAYAVLGRTGYADITGEIAEFEGKGINNNGQ